MNIVMFTNTFTPHVGGVARSVSGLAKGLRERGHSVLVIAPQFPGAPETEHDVIRIPAVQQFAGSDFSVPIPFSRSLGDDLDAFQPDIVHTHHPFLLGDTALRVSAAYSIPVVFTYHTRYELYGHYIAENSSVLKRLVLSLSLGYCDLCDHVIAPSASIAGFLADHGVKVPVTTIPTGVDPARFETGEGKRIRRRLGIADDAFVAGHVGRLAPEKNLIYLTEAMVRFLKTNTGAHLLVTGDGPVRGSMHDRFAENGIGDRVHFTGVLTGGDLADAYGAMDAFVFSSHSETQGLVLAEAMMAGVPVIALDAAGVREVVEDGKNGRLLAADASPEKFAAALSAVSILDANSARRMKDAVRQTAKAFSATVCLDRTIDLYRSLRLQRLAHGTMEDSVWTAARNSIARELEIIGNVMHAASDAVLVADEKSAMTADV